MVLLSLIPFLILYGLASEPWVWRISNALLALFLGVQVGNQIRRIKNTTRKGDLPAYPKQLRNFYIIPSAILFLVQCYAVYKASLFWYGFGLLYLLVQAAVQFWVFFTIYTRHDGVAA